MGVWRLGLVLAASAAVALRRRLASGMGGGGGGGMPGGATAPQLEPVQEYQQGMADYQAGRYKSAAGHFENVVDTQPKSANTWYMLGMAKSGNGDLKGAEKALGKSVKLDGQPVGPLRELAVTPGQAQVKRQGRRRTGDAQDAGGHLRRHLSGFRRPEGRRRGGGAGSGRCAAERIDPAPAGRHKARLDRQRRSRLYASGGSLINERRFPEALAALDQAELAFGPHPDVLTYKGYVWRKMGKLDVAEGFYQTALAEAPNHRGATEYYGELKVIRGDLAGARRLLAKLDNQCAFGCVEAEDLRRWIDHGGDPAS